MTKEQAKYLKHITFKEACAYWDKQIPVYIIYEDDTEAQIETTEQLFNHDYELYPFAVEVL